MSSLVANSNAAIFQFRLNHYSLSQAGNVVVCCQSRGCSFSTIAAAMNLPQSAFFATGNGNRHVNGHGKRQGEKKGFRQTAREARDLSTWMVQQKNSDARFAGMWWYHDAGGKVIGAVIRYDLPGKRKEFRPISIHPDGWCVRDPIGQWPLYRLPEVIANPTAIVCVFEGEKKTDAAAGIGLIATTSAHGSKSPTKTDWSILAGKDVAIFPDKDEPDEAYATRVRSIVHRLTPPAKVRIVRLPGLQHKEDIFEFVQMRETDGKDRSEIKEEVLALISTAPYEELSGIGQESAPLNDGEPLPRQDAAAKRPPPSNEPLADEPAESDPICMTEVGNGKRFVADHGAIARYCGPWEAWLFWDGRRWCTDETVMVQKLAKRTIMQSYKTALSENFIDQATSLVRRCQRP